MVFAHVSNYDALQGIPFCNAFLSISCKSNYWERDLISTSFWKSFFCFLIYFVFIFSKFKTQATMTKCLKPNNSLPHKHNKIKYALRWYAIKQSRSYIINMVVIIYFIHICSTNKCLFKELIVCRFSFEEWWWKKRNRYDIFSEFLSSA